MLKKLPKRRKSKRCTSPDQRAKTWYQTRPGTKYYRHTRSYSSETGSTVLKKKNNFSEFIFVLYEFLYEFLHCIKNNSTIPLVYPSRVTRHASLLSHRHMFIFHHALPLGLVSLSPHYHLSLLVSHHTSLCCSCLHLSRQRNLFSGKE